MVSTETGQAHADEDDRMAEERARREEEWRRQEKERLERERRARITKARAERLSEEIGAWRQAQEIREYAATLRLRLEQLDDADRDRVGAWCDWAEAWSRSTDPTVNVSRIIRLDDTSDEYPYPRPLTLSSY